MDGLYYALLEGRFLFDFVHEDKLAPKELAKYSALLLPNTALLSDAQCGQLRAYVEGGGSLLATFETSLYTERNRRRGDFGLADVFGIRKAGENIGTIGNAYLARIEKQHEILSGFSNTHWIPGAENRVPVAPVEEPGSDGGARLRGLSAGAFVSRRAADQRAGRGGAAERIEPPGVLPRRYRAHHVALRPYRSGAPAAERHRLGGGRRCAGHRHRPGRDRTFAWETQAGFAVHLLNYTNPAMHRGWLREFYAIGPQQVKMSLPAGRKVTRVELLRAETNLPFAQRGGSIEFTIPKVVDYEVAAMYSA